MPSQEPINPHELIQLLRSYAERIPDFKILTNDEILALRRASTLERDWVVEAISTIGASPTINQALDSTSDALFKEMRSMGEWSEVEAQARTLLLGISCANLIRRHRMGLKALQAYGIARQLVRQREHADLIPHVERLRQMNKLGKRKKKTPEEDK
ncbi:MAG TPA: hypothetical protein VF618_14945 [Thermoanaerobaculia bacterium]